jgi:hypothetical protein
LEFPYFVTNLAQTFLTKIQLEKNGGLIELWSAISSQAC